MEKIYFSVDVEASGKDPQRFSMIALGACVVQQPELTFYRELKPFDSDFQERALRIGCLGLRSLEEIGNRDWVYNPRYEVFDQTIVMAHLQEHGEEPREVMTHFQDWVSKIGMGRIPVFVSTSVKFDYTFITRYLSRYSLQNPFQETDDPRKLYEKLIASKDLTIEKLGLNTKELEQSHNALEDAVLQATIFRKLLEFDATN